MVLAETFWQVIWTMFIFFMWVIWLWLLTVVLIDVFRNHESSGWAKAGWCIFVIALPYLGVFVYLIAEGRGMAERRMREAQASQGDVGTRMQSAAAHFDPTGQIAGGKELLDSGAITQEEFDQIKAKALAP